MKCTMLMSTKINFNFSTMLMSMKNHMLWSIGILSSQASQVEQGPDLVLVLSQAERVK